MSHERAMQQYYWLKTQVVDVITKVLASVLKLQLSILPKNVFCTFLEFTGQSTIELN